MKFNFKIFSSLFLTVLFLSCNSSTKPDESPNEIKMDKTQYEKQIQQIEKLKNSMTEYMKTAQLSYTENNIEDCGKILIEFIKKIDETTTKESGIQVVKSTVLKLNELNEKCGFQLIETGEREQIAEIIIIAGNQKGYNSLDEDITEEWREW